MNAGFEALLRKHLRYVGDEAITDHAVLRDLGLDSLKAIELLFTLEEAYDVIFPDERLTDTTFETPRALWAVIEELKACPPDGGRP